MNQALSGPLALCAPASRTRAAQCVSEASAGQCSIHGSVPGKRGVIPGEMTGSRHGAALGRAAEVSSWAFQAPEETDVCEDSRLNSGSGGRGKFLGASAEWENQSWSVTHGQIGPIASQKRHMARTTVFAMGDAFLLCAGRFFQKTRCCFSGMHLEEMQGTKPALTAA